MIYPKKLQKGDTIGIVCTSSPITEDRVSQCKKVLEELGYQVKLADNLAKNHGGYMAGDPMSRGKAFNAMFADSEVDAIICARGGFASSGMIEFIDCDIVKNNPKIFVGYSDVTNLHMVLNQTCDLVTFHGPMVSSNMVDHFDNYTSESFFQCMEMEEKYELKNPPEMPFEVMQEGIATGTLTGGNLALLSATIGTPYEIDTKGKILFIEEIEETIYRIDRYITHLAHSGKLSDAAGLIIGRFLDCKNEKDPSYGYLELLKDVFKGLNKPILYDIQAGHGYPTATLPMGAPCTINTYDKRITFQMK